MFIVYRNKDVCGKNEQLCSRNKNVYRLQEQGCLYLTGTRMLVVNKNKDACRQREQGFCGKNEQFCSRNKDVYSLQ